MTKAMLVTMFLLSLSLAAGAHADGVVYEAEKAEVNGANRIQWDLSASGQNAVGVFEHDADTVVFLVEAPEDGIYNLTFTCRGIGGGKTNLVFVDDQEAGSFSVSGVTYEDCVLAAVPLSKGTHSVAVVKSWGWIYLDCLTVSSAEGIPDSVFDVTADLINPSASKEAQELYSLLRSAYGNFILSGQVCDGGLKGTEFNAIHDVTGKYPAILGLDMMDYTPVRIDHGARSTAVERAIEFHQAGGIVTFCWHWSAPWDTIKEGKDANGNPNWWGGFYTANCTYDFTEALYGNNPAAKAVLDGDIAAIASQLKRLGEAGVPVLWRPLHEASGGWFWWGARGAEAYKALWRYLYEQLTDVHHCNNLIWVWNGQGAEWYPGDDCVDIIGEDIYASAHSYGAQNGKFLELTGYSDENKIIALTENGVVFDVDKAFETNACWAWFCSWSGSFVVQGHWYSEAYTEKEILKKAYDSDYVITLDELPALWESTGN